MKVAQNVTLAGFFAACLLAIAGIPAALVWYGFLVLAAWSVIAVAAGVLIMLGIAAADRR